MTEPIAGWGIPERSMRRAIANLPPGPLVPALKLTRIDVGRGRLRPQCRNVGGCSSKTALALESCDLRINVLDKSLQLICRAVQ